MNPKATIVIFILNLFELPVCEMIFFFIMLRYNFSISAATVLGFTVFITKPEVFVILQSTYSDKLLEVNQSFI